MIWRKHEIKEFEKTSSLGVYFLRTDMEVGDETVMWMIYNTIRETEASFRTLKNDLDLRPIYHKNDDATMAHLHLGILAYRLAVILLGLSKMEKIGRNMGLVCSKKWRRR